MATSRNRRPKWTRALIPLALATAITIGFSGQAVAQDSPSFGSSGSADFGSTGSSSGSDQTAPEGEQDPIDIDAPSDWASGPIQNKIIPRPETVVAEAGQVTSVVGDPDEQQTVVYTPDDRTPAVGDLFVVNSGFGIPNGTVGRVTAVETLDSGLLRLTLDPATLDEAYSEFTLNTEVSFEDYTQYEAGEQSASAARARPTGFPMLGGLLRCKQGTDGFDFDAGLSDIAANVRFDLFNKYLRVELRSALSASVSLEQGASLNCVVPEDIAPAVTIPTGGPTSLKILPTLTFDASVNQSIGASVTQPIRSGFEARGSQIRALSFDNRPVLDVDLDTEITGSAKLAAGLKGKWGVNTVGWIPTEATAHVSASAYAELSASTSTPGCLRADVGLQADAGLTARAWKLVWDASLAARRFAASTSGPYCPSDPGSPDPEDPEVPGGTGTEPPVIETRPGQLTGLRIDPGLSCRVDSTTDGRSVYYGGNSCRTAVTVDGTAYGYSTGFQQIGQTSTGRGVATDPQVITTDVRAGSVNLRQVDSFVDGSSEYLTRITVTNTDGTPQQLLLYRAADCYLGNSDYGTGEITGNSVACVSPNGRSIAWTDMSGGATFEEAYYNTIWQRIGSGQPFNGTVLDSNHDNGAGLSWSLTLQPGQSVTLASRFQLLEPVTPVASPLRRGIEAPNPAKDAEMLGLGN